MFFWVLPGIWCHPGGAGAGGNPPPWLGVAAGTVDEPKFPGAPTSGCWVLPGSCCHPVGAGGGGPPGPCDGCTVSRTASVVTAAIPQIRSWYKKTNTIVGETFFFKYSSFGFKN